MARALFSADTPAPLRAAAVGILCDMQHQPVIMLKKFPFQRKRRATVNSNTTFDGASTLWKQQQGRRCHKSFKHQAVFRAQR
jgi:hypothetical protein